MRALVGLGNPGAEYEKTRHNLGFETIDAVALALGGGKWKRFLDNEVLEFHVEGEKCFLVKPQMLMNNSGKPLKAFMEYYHIEPADMCVVADDVYIAPGTARIRPTGGDGGHNGWKSVLSAIEPSTFWRVRIGAGVYEQKPEARRAQPALEEYVLHRMPKHDERVSEKLIDMLVPNLVEWLKHGTLSQETVHI